MNVSYLMSPVSGLKGATDIYSDFSGLPPQLMLVYDFENDPE